MTPEPRPDRCSTCDRLLPGPGVVVICDVCHTICLPDPDHAPTRPSDGAMVDAWNDGRWLLCVQEEDGWMPVTWRKRRADGVISHQAHIYSG